MGESVCVWVCDVGCAVEEIKCDNKINQVVFILTTRKPSGNKKYLQAPTLKGPTELYGPGPPRCTTPQQPTIFVTGLLDHSKLSTLFHVNRIPYNGRDSV